MKLRTALVLILCAVQFPALSSRAWAFAPSDNTTTYIIIGASVGAVAGLIGAMAASKKKGKKSDAFPLGHDGDPVIGDLELHLVPETTERSASRVPHPARVNPDT